MATAILDPRLGPSDAVPDSQPDLVPQVERALFQLYQDPDPDRKSAADRWLQVLQASPQAWSTAWLLLQHQSVEVQNFGALTLHSKITKNWADLPQSEYGPLRLELFKAMARFSCGPSLVLIQLCKGLVAFSFQTMPEVWPNAVVSMIHSLRSATESVPNSCFSTVVLQLLTILPEEFDSTCTSVVAAKRGVLRRELQQALSSVLSLLEDVLSSSQPNNIKLAAIKCCHSWVQFGLPLPEISSLIDHLFLALLDQELFFNACEALTRIVSHDDSHKYPLALKKLFLRVLQLRELVHTKLEVPEEMENCSILCDLVKETAEANMNVFLSLSEESAEDCGSALEMMQLILDFTCIAGCYPVNELCSERTLYFWEHFLDCIASAEPEQCKFLLDIYGSCISSLMEAFPEKAQYPPDNEWEDLWIEDDRDNFTKYREDLCDLAESLQRTMHLEYLQHLSTILSTHLNTSSTPAWQPVESVLFLLQGVASNTTQQSSVLWQNILSLFPRMPSHPALIKTALALLGFLSSWFKQHLDLLQAVLPMILNALVQPDLAPSAALAFRDVCGECSEQLSPLVVQLIPACQAGLANPDMEIRDCIRLIAAIGSVLSSMPLSKLVAPLESLIASRVHSLQELAMEDAWEEKKGLVEKELAVLSSLCHHIYPTLLDGEEHPVVLLLVQLWPSLQTLISKWCNDQDVVEAICICWNRAMRTVQEQYLPLLGGTIELIIKCYAAVYYAKLLDSAAQLVELFGKESSCSQIISTLLQQMHSLSLVLFQAELSNHPDVLQAYLNFVSAALKCCPLLLLGLENIASNIFEIGVAALELPEQPTVMAAANFLVSFISLAPSVDSVREILSLKGLALVQYTLQAIAGIAPRSYLSAFSDVLSALNTHCVGLLSQWLEELLVQEGFPSHHVSLIEKEHFKSTVLREQSNKRVLKDKVKEFSFMCRGFHGTLYAAATS